MSKAYREPMRVIHAAVPTGIAGIGESFWALLDCGHVSEVPDKYREVSCSCCMGKNRKWTTTEFRREFRTLRVMAL